MGQLVKKQQEKWQLLLQRITTLRLEYQLQELQDREAERTKNPSGLCMSVLLPPTVSVVKSYYYGNIQVNQQSVVLQSEGEEVTFSGRSYHFEDGAHHEIMTLENEDALALLNFIDTHRKHKIRVEGKGDKPTRNWVYYLNEKEKQALSATYQLGWLMKDIKRIEDIQHTASAQIERYQQKRNK